MSEIELKDISGRERFKKDIKTILVVSKNTAKALFSPKGLFSDISSIGLTLIVFVFIYFVVVLGLIGYKIVESLIL